MTGKKTVVIIIVFTVIFLMLAWFWLEYIIHEYNIDRAMSTKDISIRSIQRIIASSFIHIK
jgi:hypothetical protein